MIAHDLSLVPVDEAEFCVLDVETTGLSPYYNNIIEIGIIKVSGLTITDSYHSLVNPQKEVPYYITQLTGITNDDVYDAPFFEDIADKISDFIAGHIIVGHNLSFDKSFLKKEFEACGREVNVTHNVCTLKIARRIYPALKSKSLGSVCNHLGIHNLSEHRALGDAKVTARLLIKMIAELKENYGIHFADELIKFQAMARKELKVKVKQSLSSDLAALPHAPGVYYFLNAKNDIIYIGKAKSLRDRVKSYFSSSAPRKAKKIIKQASRLKIQLTNSELTALLNEAELIKVINPRHNTMLKSYGNKYFLRVNKSQEFPSIEISNSFNFDGNDYFGLFISRRKAAEIYDMLAKTFAVRECNEKEFKKNRRCFLADIERCTAPCANGDQELYNAELEKVYEFLYGKNQFALSRLINKMKEYSDEQKFEKAAEVKQLIDLILAQTHKSSLLAEPVNLANVLFEVNGGFGKDYILMLAGKIFVKKNSSEKKDYFEDALDDFFEHTVLINAVPDDEDLEKMKITLNWLIKNRNTVRMFYLKDYQAKEELYRSISKFKVQYDHSERTFDIKDFMKDRLEEYTGVQSL
jgi:DNA polymerase III subunit epsilon